MDKPFGETRSPESRGGDDAPAKLSGLAGILIGAAVVFGVIVLLLQTTEPPLPEFPLKIAEDLTVLDVKFFAYDDGSGENLAYMENGKIIVPYKAKRAYGWYMAVDSTRPVIEFVEAFTIPEAPDTWGQAEAMGLTEVSEDRRTATTAVAHPVVENRIQHGWSIAEGDPKGDYLMRIWIDGVPVKTLRFYLR